MVADAYLEDIKKEFGPDFEISTGILLSYNCRNIYVIQNKDRWQSANGKTLAGLVGIGGKLEEGESISDCARRECLEEIGTEVQLQDAKTTYLFADGNFRKFEIKGNELKPSYLVINPKSEPGRKPYTLVVVYDGKIQEKPNPQDVAGVLYISDNELLDSFATGESTLEAALHRGAILEEKTNIPQETTLRLFGTAKAHLSFLLADH